jgi:hypothetical protein
LIRVIRSLKMKYAKNETMNGTDRLINWTYTAFVYRVLYILVVFVTIMQSTNPKIAFFEIWFNCLNFKRILGL